MDIFSESQSKALEEILYKNDTLVRALEIIPEMGLNDWYIAGGIVSQTVWNYYHKFNLNSHIKDIDLVYFDPNTSYVKEDEYIQKGNRLFAKLPIEVEIRNQARVHLWHKNENNKLKDAYKSTEEGIASWLTRVTCIGVRKTNKQLEIYAPYGLEDLFNLDVFPNKISNNKSAYYTKTNRWKKVWPKLTIYDWDSY